MSVIGLSNLSLGYLCCVPSIKFLNSAWDGRLLGLSPHLGTDGEKVLLASVCEIWRHTPPPPPPSWRSAENPYLQFGRGWWGRSSSTPPPSCLLRRSPPPAKCSAEVTDERHKSRGAFGRGKKRRDGDWGLSRSVAPWTEEWPWLLPLDL